MLPSILIFQPYFYFIIKNKINIKKIMEYKINFYIN